jgi:hypothetical protein
MYEYECVGKRTENKKERIVTGKMDGTETGAERRGH